MRTAETAPVDLDAVDAPSGQRDVDPQLEDEIAALVASVGRPRGRIDVDVVNRRALTASGHPVSWSVLEAALRRRGWV